MDIEAFFMNSFSIKKKLKPDDLFDLIEIAIGVGGSKYPTLLEKRKSRIIKMLLYPDKQAFTDDDDDEDDNSTLDDEEGGEEENNAGHEDEVTNVEEEKQAEVGTQQIITAPTIPKPSLKFRLKITRSAQVAPLENHNNCNAMEELKKISETEFVVDKQLDAKQGTRQQSDNTTVGSRKRPTLVAPPAEKKLISDFSFEKQLDGNRQLQKESHKGFKKMESLAKNKREKQKECTSGLTKSMPLPLRKMNNVATKCVQVAPNQKQLLSDCSPKKQIDCSAITKPYQKNYFRHFDELSPNQNGFILAISLADVLNRAISKLNKMMQTYVLNFGSNCRIQKLVQALSEDEVLRPCTTLDCLKFKFSIPKPVGDEITHNRPIISV